MYKWIWILSFLLITSTSNSQENSSHFIFTPAFLYREEARVRNEQSSYNLTLLDVKLGYQFSNSTFIGLYFGYDQENIQADNYPTIGVTTRSQYNRSDYGFSLGYVRYDYYVIFTVIVNSQWELKESQQKLIYSNALGGALDFGVNFKIGDFISIGPRLTLKILEYSTVNNGATVTGLSPSLRRSVIEPYFVTWFEF